MCPDASSAQVEGERVGVKEDTKRLTAAWIPLVFGLHSDQDAAIQCSQQFTDSFNLLSYVKEGNWSWKIYICLTMAARYP